MTKKHPTKKELKGKPWYRGLTVAFWIIIILTAIGPFYLASQAPLFNAVIAVGLNIIILLVIWEIIYYIIYGPGKKDKFIDGFLKVVLWTVLGLIMAISIIAISTVYK